MSFKLIGLRAAGKIPYLKNLQPNYLYCFSSDYIFEGNNNEFGTYELITGIENKESFPQDMYNLSMANEKKLSINISAILGKNGSGKSSLLELLYLQIYCLAEEEGYLKEREYNQRHVERKFTRNYFNNTYRSGVDQVLLNTYIESYFEIDGNYHVAVQASGKCCIYTLIDKEWKVFDYQSDIFFYSIVVNYSLYGLNDSGRFFWLQSLFHKNDGYKTPIVLNPYRESGNIDVNSELHLAQSRVLTNLVDERFQTDHVLDDRSIEKVSFIIDPDLVGWIEGLATLEVMDLTKQAGNGDLEYVAKQFIQEYTRAEPKFLDGLYSVSLDNFRYNYNNERVRKHSLSRNSTRASYEFVMKLLAEYIYSKIGKICAKYEDFKEFTIEMPHPEGDKRTIRVISDNEGAIKGLLKNSSHVTLKLKQAVNAFVYHYFSDETWVRIAKPEDAEKYTLRCELSAARFAELINKHIRKKDQAIHYIPAAMFRPLLEIASVNGASSFAHMSSGEQQMLHSIHCILYHLLNIDSLSPEVASYRNVNIVLDEIELYYHPEYQRQFIARLRSYLKRLKLDTVKHLNIIFSTHSPFILSDIPVQNVLKLENGKELKAEDDEKTFGSNIHEMLALSFFLDNELIGVFAKEHIEETITDISTISANKRKAKKSDKKAEKAYAEAKSLELASGRLMKRIEIIGERVIYLKLKEMYREVFETEQSDKQQAILEIQKLMGQFGLLKKDF